MDYVEAFKNLRTNNKYGRKSPHKAVLMLTVIELFEKSVLTENEICYDDKLKSTFLKVWNRVLPDEPLFHPDAYLPFWYLQNDSFWHIVPTRGKEDILSLMRDTNIKPSEAKLNDSVKYAELDDDLYFLMTIPSGRSSLKRALLETYTSLSAGQIDRIAASEDNTVDHSAAALSEYESLLAANEDEKEAVATETDNMMVRQFQSLSEDLQIALNLEYYTFLKKHRSEREAIKEICPTVYDLLDRIAHHPVRQEEIAPSFAFSYENFLADLKISLMSENDSMELIDKIDSAIGMLRGNCQETEETDAPQMEEERLGEDDYPTLGIEQQDEKEESFTAPIPEDVLAIENRRGRAWTENEEELITLYFKQGRDAATIAEIVGRTEVAIKMRLAKLGLIEYTYEQEDSPDTLGQDITPSAVSLRKQTLGNVYTFVPKGKLKCISEVAEESYDFLLAMAVVEFMQFVPQPAIITLDRLACMMIAVAWEIFGEEEEARMKEKELRECIEFLMTESKEEMSNVLTWHSSRKEIFNAIKDYPMADVFEDTVDRLTEKAPYNVLKAWIKDESTEEIVRNSNAPSATCLYGIHPMKRNPYIEVKQGWMRYLRNEHDSLMTYFRRLYMEYLA